MKAKRVQKTGSVPMNLQKTNINGYKIVEKKGSCMCGKIQKK